MVFPMGCGGSRADAIIEPRYHESWTRETESTWLTNTDVDTSVPVANSKALEASLREKRMVNTGTQCGKQAFGSMGSNHQRRPRRSLTDSARDVFQKTVPFPQTPSSVLEMLKHLNQHHYLQTTRDSKRRSSKEAGTTSKDGQSVTEDPEQVEYV